MANFLVGFGTGALRQANQLMDEGRAAQYEQDNRNAAMVAEAALSVMKETPGKLTELEEADTAFGNLVSIYGQDKAEAMMGGADPNKVISGEISFPEGYTPATPFTTQNQKKREQLKVGQRAMAQVAGMDMTTYDKIYGDQPQITAEPDQIAPTPKPGQATITPPVSGENILQVRNGLVEQVGRWLGKKSNANEISYDPVTKQISVMNPSLNLVWSLMGSVANKRVTQIADEAVRQGRSPNGADYSQISHEVLIKYNTVADSLIRENGGEANVTAVDNAYRTIGYMTPDQFESKFIDENNKMESVIMSMIRAAIATDPKITDKEAAFTVIYNNMSYTQKLNEYNNYLNSLQQPIVP